MLTLRVLCGMQGVVPTLLMVANPTVQYMIYEWLRARLAESKAQGKLKAKRPNYTAGEVFVMSAIAKLGATVVTYPMQLVKSRLQVNQHISPILQTLQLCGSRP
jgi:adenine nucleotide transporter 17